MGKPKVILFADGSCPRPHGAGGWAYILRLVDNGIEKVGSGGEVVTTNNRMELMGVIAALRVLPIACQLEIVCDSQYVVYGMSKWMKNWKKKGWRKKNWHEKTVEDVPNKDLWIELDHLLELHDVTATWVRGHNGHPENERCDVMAGEETKKITRSIMRLGPFKV